jgi:capsular exopolysaccharide synthesis family protein
LLIDADLRRPCAHEIFKLDGSAGLTTVLAEGVDWRNVVQHSDVDNLDVLTAGPMSDNPSELLSSLRFHALLQGVRREYDHVLIDTSAMLKASDPCVVAHQADGVLLAIPIHKRARRDAERAVDAMGPHASRLMGVVVNNLHGRRLLDGADPFTSRRLNADLGAPGLAVDPAPFPSAGVDMPLTRSNGAQANHESEADGHEELLDLKALLRETSEEIRHLKIQTARDAAGDSQSAARSTPVE